MKWAITYVVLYQKKELIIMCAAKHLLVLISGIFMMVAAAGCTGPAANTLRENGPGESLRPGYDVVYHPKLETGASIGSIQKELDKIGVKGSECVFVSDDASQYRDWQPLLQIKIGPDLIRLRRHSPVFNDLSSNSYLIALSEMPPESPSTRFSTDCLLKDPVMVERSQELTNYPYVIFLKNLIAFRFSKNDLATAQTMADAFFFLQEQQKGKQAKLDEQLARFEPVASQYRALAIKPAVSEEQRRLIVQANAANQQKAYGRAIDLYLEAVELDPVSYPAAYFNLALLSAQLERYSRAIGYMRQYLLLVPDAPDARSAKDKIYEWEFMIKRN